MTTEKTTRRAILRGGMRISSADCGMTSKPTNRNGTTASTSMNPPTPPWKSGWVLAVSPPTNAPAMSTRATSSRKDTTKVCTSEVILMPRMLSQVSSTAVIEPMSAQVRCTSKPATVHRWMCSMLGTR